MRNFYAYLLRLSSIEGTADLRQDGYPPRHSHDIRSWADLSAVPQ